MGDLSWAKVVALVHERAAFTCEYCQTVQRNIGQAMHVDHIDPDGGDDPDNLCLSCANCNMSKARATVGADPTTGFPVPLFNPRRQKWHEHFTWSSDQVMLNGLTPIGRATIARLKINRERMLATRQLWVTMGVHPPD